jgi:hypothetical protein
MADESPEEETDQDTGSEPGPDVSEAEGAAEELEGSISDVEQDEREMKEEENEPHLQTGEAPGE